MFPLPVRTDRISFWSSLGVPWICLDISRILMIFYLFRADSRTYVDSSAMKGVHLTPPFLPSSHPIRTPALQSRVSTPISSSPDSFTSSLNLHVLTTDIYLSLPSFFLRRRDSDNCHDGDGGPRVDLSGNAAHYALVDAVIPLLTYFISVIIMYCLL